MWWCKKCIVHVLMVDEEPSNPLKQMCEQNNYLLKAKAAILWHFDESFANMNKITGQAFYKTFLKIQSRAF